MSPDDPRHGTPAGAQAHWKDGEPACLPCERARYRSNKAAAYRVAQGDRSRAPLGEDAWRILDHCSITEIARQSGLNRNMLYRIHKAGPERIVIRATRERILATRTYTPIGIIRRLQALAAIGHSATDIAARIGCHHVNVCEARRREEPKFARPEFAAKVLAVYAELHMSPKMPPYDRFVSRQINQARRNGWLPPLAWEDIDDPNERPNLETIEKRDTLTEYRFLRSLGVGIEQAARQLGITVDGIEQALRREKAVA